MDVADIAIVYYNLHTIEHKRLEAITEEQVKQAFKRDDLIIFTDSSELQKYLRAQDYSDYNLLLMSSGNYDGIDVDNFAKELLIFG
jgi:UDP-N-acetylmuramate: L-alanyl-gamma-D-glutamyl-meso-diaminopimelate ligase